MAREIWVRIRRWQFVVGVVVCMAGILLAAEHTFRDPGGGGLRVKSLRQPLRYEPDRALEKRTRHFDSIIAARPGLLDSIRAIWKETLPDTTGN